MTTSNSQRILLVHERYRQAGGEDGVFDAQVALLRRRGHEVATLEADNDGIAERVGLGGRLRLASDTIWSRDGRDRVRAAIRAFRPDVMHAHNTLPLLSPAIHAAAHDEGVATVQTLHNYRLICPSGVLYRDGRPCHDCVGRVIALPGIAHGCYRDSRSATAAIAAMNVVHRARRTWSHDVDQVVVLAGFARDLLVRGGVPARRIVVQPNFVDRDPVVPADPGEGFLFVGRLTEDKGVGTILEAWERLPSGIGLTFAGDGPLEPAVREAARRNPSIKYVGRLDQPDVAAAIGHARAVLVPSHLYENCPLTVLEAYAGGRPVIASGHGGLAEIVVDGVTGLHVAPGDASSLGSAVLHADAEPATMLEAGRAGQAQFVARYTPEHGYIGLLETYRRATEVHRARVARRPA